MPGMPEGAQDKAIAAAAARSGVSSISPTAVVTSTRGKGKVKLRKAQAGQGQPWVPKLTSISHCDAEHGEREGDPRPRYPAELAGGWVDYVALDTPQGVYRALSAVWDHRPVLLRGSPLAAVLVGKLGFRQIAEAAVAVREAPHVGTGTEGQQVDVMCSEAHRHRFFECDDAKNAPAAPYRVRSPETQRLRMELVEFVQCAQSWGARKVMLRAIVMQHQPPSLQAPLEHPQAGGAPGADRPALAPGALASALGTQLRDAIDWAWLAGFRRAQRFGPVLRVDLEAGTAGGLLPARYAVHAELLAQVVGRRRVLLVGPEHAFAGMYPFPTAHPYDRYSMVDFEAACTGDVGRWPRARGVRGLACVLRPGDVLFVPPYWFVHSQDLEAESVCLRCALGPGTRPPARDAAPLRLSRALEERVADVEGPAKVRRWLQLIGRGVEGDLLDLSTVAGYRRVVMCQGVRDEVEQALGAGAWAALLPAMCEGRLTPTPWLEDNAREPLLLGGGPVVREDTRTEEERRYPQLFRRKLEAEGWAVPAAVSTVPVPGVNMPVGADYRTL